MMFRCEQCNKEFKGNKDKSNKDFIVCTKDDKCECGGTFKLVVNGTMLK